MKYFLIAGEKSGDQHAGALIKALNKIDTQSSIEAWGGNEMQAAGARILQRYESMAFMGLDFLLALPTILRLFRKCKADIENSKPDAVVFIDFGGFNLRMAKWAHKKGYRCFYFIPPKTWAWNEGRNKKLAAYTEEAYVILPFEEAYLKSNGVNAKYVGNPTKEHIDQIKANLSFERNGIALLPGSRVGEVKRIQPLLKRIVEQFPEENFTIAGISQLNKEIYSPMLNLPNVRFVCDKTFELLQRSKLAIVTSGTATLETALFRTPQIVVYRAGKLLYLLGKRLVKVKYISLVNLIANKEVVKEYIQDDFTFEQLANNIKLLLESTKKREEQLLEYDLIEQKLGSKIASKEAANNIYQKLRKNRNED